MTPLPVDVESARRAPNHFPLSSTEEICSYGKESVRRTETKSSRWSVATITPSWPALIPGAMSITSSPS